MRERLPNIWAIATEYDIRKILCGDLAMIRWERGIEIGMYLQHSQTATGLFSVFFCFIYSCQNILYPSEGY